MADTPYCPLACPMLAAVLCRAETLALPASSRLVAAVLVSAADADGRWEISHRELARVSGYHRVGHLTAALRRLVDAGITTLVLGGVDRERLQLRRTTGQLLLAEVSESDAEQ